jgi:hypothetical protein
MSTTLKQHQANGQPTLTFTFQGKFTYREALKFGEAWREVFNAQPDSQFVVTFDALEMKDYEAGARITWQKIINELKSQIQEIYLVTDSRFIATGAKLMGLFTSFEIKTVSSKSDLFAEACL